MTVRLANNKTAGVQTALEKKQNSGRCASTAASTHSKSTQAKSSYRPTAVNGPIPA